MKLNIFESKERAYIHPSLVEDLDFAKFVKFMKEGQAEVVRKEDPMMFNLCSWIDDFESPEHKPGFIRRCKANVAQIYALLLDIDGTRTLEDAVTEFVDYEFLIYSTFGNSKDKEKFRLVLPLNTALTSLEFDQRYESMCETFRVDPASFTISQAFYLPCYNKDNADISFIHWNQQPKRYEALFLPVKERIVIERDDTDYEPKTVEQVGQVLDELKKYYPDLNYSIRCDVTWAVVSSVGSIETIDLMRSRWDDSEKTGKYEFIVKSRKREGITLGTIYHMIRQYNPQFGKQIKKDNDWRTRRRQLADKYV